MYANVFTSLFAEILRFDNDKNDNNNNSMTAASVTTTTTTTKIAVY